MADATAPRYPSRYAVVAAWREGFGAAGHRFPTRQLQDDAMEAADPEKFAWVAGRNAGVDSWRANETRMRLAEQRAEDASTELRVTELQRDVSLEFMRVAASVLAAGYNGDPGGQLDLIRQAVFEEVPRATLARRREVKTGTIDRTIHRGMVKLAEQGASPELLSYCRAHGTAASRRERLRGFLKSCS